MARLQPNNSTVIYRIEESVGTIRCLASGDPAATSLRWSRADNVQLSFFDAFINELTLRRITPAKQATYVCTATSSIGSSVARLNVIVACKYSVLLQRNDLLT